MWFMSSKIWFFWFFQPFKIIRKFLSLWSVQKQVVGRIGLELWLADPCSREALYPWPSSDIESSSALNYYLYTGRHGNGEWIKVQNSVLFKHLKDNLKKGFFKELPNGSHLPQSFYCCLPPLMLKWILRHLKVLLKTAMSSPQIA